MFLLTTMASSTAMAAEQLTRASDVPEPVSMALLSIVLAGASMVVRRTGTKADDQVRRERGTSPRS